MTPRRKTEIGARVRMTSCVREVCENCVYPLWEVPKPHHTQKTSLAGHFFKRKRLYAEIVTYSFMCIVVECGQVLAFGLANSVTFHNGHPSNTAICCVLPFRLWLSLLLFLRNRIHDHSTIFRNVRSTLVLTLRRATFWAVSFSGSQFDVFSSEEEGRLFGHSRGQCYSCSISLTDTWPRRFRLQTNQKYKGMFFGVWVVASSVSLFSCLAAGCSNSGFFHIWQRLILHCKGRMCLLLDHHQFTVRAILLGTGLFGVF